VQISHMDVGEMRCFPREFTLILHDYIGYSCTPQLYLQMS